MNNWFLAVALALTLGSIADAIREQNVKVTIEGPCAHVAKVVNEREG